MKKLLFLLLIIPSFLYANDGVDIYVDGWGADKEAAINAALRSAVEQTYETFVSKITSDVKSKFASDVIVSPSSGNIQNYKILLEEEFEEFSEEYSNGWWVILHATIDINHLAKYIKGESSSISVNMNAFNTKILMEEMLKTAEKKIVDHLVVIIESLENMWYYTLVQEDNPIILDDDKYRIKGKVNVHFTRRAQEAVNLLRNVLSVIDVKNQPASMVNATKSYILYDHGPNLGVKPLLRNEYDNSLLSYHEWTSVNPGPDYHKHFKDYGIQPVRDINKGARSPFLKKMGFVITPLNIRVDGVECFHEEKNSGGFIEYDDDDGKYYICLSKFAYYQSDNKHGIDYLFMKDKDYNIPYEVDDIVFVLPFTFDITRQEALKITKLSVEPLDVAVDGFVAAENFITYVYNEYLYIIGYDYNDHGPEPEFPGDALGYIKQKLPNGLNCSQCIGLAFVVEKNGAVSNVQIYPPSCNGKCDDIIGTFTNMHMPLWNVDQDDEGRSFRSVGVYLFSKKAKNPLFFL